MELKYGAKYAVEIDDCCVGGYFESELQSAYGLDDDDNKIKVYETDYGIELYFENGVRLAMMGGVGLEEIN